MKINKLSRIALSILCTSGFVQMAEAGSSSANLGVSATVAANCSISTTAVNFGSYDPIAASDDTDGNGAVTVKCVKGTSHTIALGLGSNASGSNRRMTDGTDFITYTLQHPPSTTPNDACVFPAVTQVWGTAGAALFNPGSAPSNGNRTYKVCATATASQDVQAGSYSDTVTATVNF